MDFKIFDMDDGKAPKKQSFIAGTEGFMEEPPKKFLITHKDFKTTSLSESTIDEVLEVISYGVFSGFGFDNRWNHQTSPKYVQVGIVPHWTHILSETITLA